MFFTTSNRMAAVLGATVTGSMAMLGCSVQTRASAPVDGTLALDWSINGTTDPNECHQAVASSLTVDVFDGAGAFGHYSASCDSFVVRMSLPPGVYTARARLVDSGGNSRTTTVDVNSFDIASGAELDIPIDFPANSFR